MTPEHYVAKTAGFYRMKQRGWKHVVAKMRSGGPVFERASFWLVAAYAGLFLFSVAAGFFRHNARVGAHVAGIDSVHYYAYLRSAIMDGDLDLRNEMARFYGGQFPFKGKDGSPGNIFPVGPAILWSPFFLAGHVFTLVSRAFGGGLPADGYSFWYQASVYVGNSLYGLAGLLLTARVLMRFFGPGIAAGAGAVLMLATPLTYYLFPIEVIAHCVSFFCVAAFLALYVKGDRPYLLAAVGGLMFLCRWQDALFLLLPAWDAFRELAGRKQAPVSRGWWRRRAVQAGVFFLCATPQLAAWKAIYGRWLLVPQGEGFLSLQNTHLWDVLFSMRHGLFSWHPVLLLGLAGLFVGAAPTAGIRRRFLACFIAQWLVNASVLDWWAGWSFGNRRFINLLPVFGLGLACLLQRAVQKRGRAAAGAAAVLAVALSCWNLAFVAQYQHGTIPRGEAVTWKEFSIDKFFIADCVRCQDLLDRGVGALYRNRRDVFNKLVSDAYQIDPDYRNARFLRALACVLSNCDPTEGRRVFASLAEGAPDDGWAAWGLVYFMARQGDWDGAGTLLDNGAFRSLPATTQSSVREKVARRSSALLDEEFLKIANLRIDGWISSQVIVLK